MLTCDQVIKDIEKILTEKLDVKLKEEFTAETSFFKEGLALDSVMILELIIELELMYNIEIDEDEETMKHFKKAGSLAEFIVEKVGTK